MFASVSNHLVGMFPQLEPGTMAPSNSQKRYPPMQYSIVLLTLEILPLGVPDLALISGAVARGPPIHGRKEFGNH
jgi:hypothetical protein